MGKVVDRSEMDGIVYTHLRNPKMHRERVIDFLMIIQHSSRGNQQCQHTIWLAKNEVVFNISCLQIQFSEDCNKA